MIVDEKTIEKDDIIQQYIKQSIKMLCDNNIVLPKAASANIYHHCGYEHLYEVGAMFINVVNRDYCKSYVVMHPGQQYPEHYHKIKTESFYILHGELIVNVNGKEYKLVSGEIFHVERGWDHSFRTRNGVIFEEISTMYVPNDSVYNDEIIRSRTYTQRRTTITEQKWKEIIKNA